MNTIKKIGLVSAVAFALFAFNACGDDSGSTSASGENSSSHMSSSTPIEDLDESSSSGKVPESAEGTGGVSSSVAPNGGERSSSSSRKTSSKSEESSSSLNSSVGGSEERYPCKYEGDNQYWMGDVQYICEGGFLVPYIAPSSSSLSLHAKDSIKHPESIFKDNEKFSFYYDNRDGLEKKYTVYMEHTSSGDTLYVFVDNLNYGKQVLSSETEFDDNVVEKYCYNDDPWYCDNYYGALYTWSEAMALPKVCESLTQDDSRCQIKTSKKGGHQGICPEGWFVMSVRNWSDAFLNDGGIPNSSLYYSGDTHTILGLIYTGHLQQFGKDTAEYEAIWESAYFWSASENTFSDKATAFFTYNSMYPQTDYDRFVSKRNAYPVRCARIVEEAE